MCSVCNEYLRIIITSYINIDASNSYRKSDRFIIKVLPGSVFQVKVSHSSKKIKIKKKLKTYFLPFKIKKKDISIINQ